MPSPPQLARRRYHAMDALRGAAMLLGVVLHVSMAYIPGELDILWPSDTQRSDAFLMLFLAIHLFRLQLFFLVAGFFARLLHQRLGTTAFLQHRGHRIALPLVIGYVTLVPACVFLIAYGVTGSVGLSGEVVLHRLATGQMAHLWFLYFLLVYYVAAVCCVVPLWRRAVGPGRSRRLDRAYRTALRSPWKPVLLVPFLLSPMLFSPHWASIGLSSHVLPEPRVLLYYAIFFAIGWWLHRNTALLAALRQYTWIYLFAAVALFAAIIATAPADEPARAADPAFLAMRVLVCLYTWTMLFAVMGLFLKFLDVARPWVRYLADASYWCYLAHLPIVLAMQILLRDAVVSPWIKASLVLAVTIALLWITYHYGVRYTWIGTMLNGRRPREAADRPWPAAATASPAAEKA